jgi:hypothetical protein
MDQDDYKLLQSLTVKVVCSGQKVLDDIAIDIAAYLVKKRETNQDQIWENSKDIVDSIRKIVQDPDMLTTAATALENGIKRHVNRLLEEQQKVVK